LCELAAKVVAVLVFLIAEGELFGAGCGSEAYSGGGEAAAAIHGGRGCVWMKFVEKGRGYQDKSSGCYDPKAGTYTDKGWRLC
jgi:hypothetical protein